MKKEYFLLINKQTNEKLVCSWWQNEPDFFGQKVHYIGVSEGLGGLQSMESKGFKYKPISEIMRVRLNRAIERTIEDIAIQLEADEPKDLLVQKAIKVLQDANA